MLSMDDCGSECDAGRLRMHLQIHDESQSVDELPDNITLGSLCQLWILLTVICLNGGRMNDMKSFSEMSKLEQ